MALLILFAFRARGVFLSLRRGWTVVRRPRRTVHRSEQRVLFRRAIFGAVVEVTIILGVTLFLLIFGVLAIANSPV